MATTTPEDYLAEATNNTLATLAGMLEIDWKYGCGGLLNLVEAIYKKFASEKTPEEREFGEALDSMAIGCMQHFKGEFGLFRLAERAQRLRNACDPDALARGELKAASAKKGPMLESLLDAALRTAGGEE